MPVLSLESHHTKGEEGGRGEVTTLKKIRVSWLWLIVICNPQCPGLQMKSIIAMKAKKKDFSSADSTEVTIPHFTDGLKSKRRD